MDQVGRCVAALTKKKGRRGTSHQLALMKMGVVRLEIYFPGGFLVRPIMSAPLMVFECGDITGLSTKPP